MDSVSAQGQGPLNNKELVGLGEETKFSDQRKNPELKVCIL
jgi:hypothetical protein